MASYKTLSGYLIAICGNSKKGKVAGVHIRYNAELAESGHISGIAVFNMFNGMAA